MDVHVTMWNNGNGRTNSPPVVLVHGSTSWGDDREFGFTHQKPLADRLPLLAIDRRGHGAENP